MPAIAQNSSKNTTKNQALILSDRYASNEEAMRFADDVAERRNLDKEWVRQAIGQARFIPTVQRLMRPMQPSASGVIWKNWRVYRSRFIDNVRIQAGVKFWRENSAALERAEAEFGVPAEIIVGIIGVETIYGRDMGTFRVIDALATLAFDFPKTPKRDRSPFFRDELEQFLSLTNRSNVDPLEFRGSYAGAMGLGQFMPSSWVKYAIDFDGNGKVDLFNSPTDAIGSVANYFKSFGWKTGQPTHYPVSFDAVRLDKEALLAPDILPTFNIDSFQAKGAVLRGEALNHIGPLALIELQNGDPALSAGNAQQYVAGTENFYVITRYNWSSYYAMSVIDLGAEVKAALK
ncbi:lytic murein transglycosylase B [Variovorax sp. PCZ-1]|uniref:lytic murein transglycosylase B n=1 Tax=Variovorax sp. PCZ-1 TaxID=2835533 RepID=UPI0020C1529C|nr:lytic murein transglycosylase B [Variovorax sp. PCZ-1]